MTLVDTGPFVALFDPRDHLHTRCRKILRRLRGPLLTTVPVLTEAFHLLTPGSRGAENVRDFITAGGCRIFFLDDSGIERAFALMRKYADQPMDLADASIIVAAEATASRRVFTLDHKGFSAYRMKVGHRDQTIEIIG